MGHYFDNWRNRVKHNPDNFDENGRYTRRGFIRAVLHFIAYEIIFKGIQLSFQIAVIILALWSIWGMTWGIVRMCQVF